MSRLTNIQARRTRARSGYTLVELLVTMALLGVVSTVMVKLMMGQQRFYQKQSSQMDVRRELRTTMTMLPADLRSLSSSGGDLTNFSSTSITFRNVLGASIVCAKPNNHTMDLPPLSMARNTLTAWYTQPQVGDTVFAFNEGLLRGAEDDSWTGMIITSVSQDASFCPASVYTDAALDAGKPRFRIVVGPIIPDSVKIGAGLRFVRSTRYSLAASATNNWYLYRSEYQGGAWGTDVPVTGPFNTALGSAPGGLRFTFFDSTGAPVVNVANSRSVARIDLFLSARGVSASNTGPSATVQDSLTFRIALRNRQ